VHAPQLRAPPALFNIVAFDLDSIGAYRLPLGFTDATELPPREVLQERLHRAIASARERLGARAASTDPVARGEAASKEAKRAAAAPVVARRAPKRTRG
jgi:hypothetical protein